MIIDRIEVSKEFLEGLKAKPSGEGAKLKSSMAIPMAFGIPVILNGDLKGKSYSIKYKNN